MDTSELLKELRIERDGGPPRSRRRWIVWAAAAVLVAALAAWLVLGRLLPTTVRTAVARAGASGAAGSVLDASGYVTARRQATVSAKITGKVTEVRIEEGMRVEEGAVLAARTRYEEDWFDTEGLRGLLNGSDDGSADREFTLWRVLNTKLWLRTFWGDGADPLAR